ncbi:MAG: M48 family metalloprotease [Thermodesulfobacteriota bacterium]
MEASRPINDSEEYYVGRAVAARIFSMYPLYQDEGLTLYVNLVGQAVARKSSRPFTFRGYHFAVLDSMELNAFACPGGIVLITRGLLDLCEDEDQLAAVLAHEVGHVAHKDGINSISQARWAAVLTFVGTRVVKDSGGIAAKLISLFEGSIEDVFKTIVVNGYSRFAEEEADAEAVKTLAEAGYDPRAMAALLDKMASLDKGGGGLLSTHPPVNDRISKVKAMYAETSPVEVQDLRISRFKTAARGQLRQPNP